MFKLNDTSKGFAPRPNLHCVWIRANELPNAPFVAVWIDLEMTAFKASKDEQQAVSASSAVFASEPEPPPPAFSASLNSCGWGNVPSAVLALTENGINHSLQNSFSMVNQRSPEECTAAIHLVVMSGSQDSSNRIMESAGDRIRKEALC